MSVIKDTSVYLGGGAMALYYFTSHPNETKERLKDKLNSNFTYYKHKYKDRYHSLSKKNEKIAKQL